MKQLFKDKTLKENIQIVIHVKLTHSSIIIKSPNKKQQQLIASIVELLLSNSRFLEKLSFNPAKIIEIIIQIHNENLNGLKHFIIA